MLGVLWIQQVSGAARTLPEFKTIKEFNAVPTGKVQIQTLFIFRIIQFQKQIHSAWHNALSRPIRPIRFHLRPYEFALPDNYGIRWHLRPDKACPHIKGSLRGI